MFSAFSSTMIERLLVTGVTGFVGRAVARRAQVRGTIRGAVRSEASDIPQGIDPVFVGDISGSTDWTQALSGVECVVHLAGRAHILEDTGSDGLAEYRSVNVDATRNLARRAAECGVKRLVFLSSIKVNGNRNEPDKPYTEADPPARLEALDAYALSKLEAERGLMSVAAASGMEVVIIRPPLVYGQGVKANFAALIRAVARGVPLPFGAVRNRRSLIGVDNLADFILLCTTHPDAANQLFLASDGEDLSTPQLIRRIGRALGRKARLIPVPASALAAAARLVGKAEVADRLLGSLCLDPSKARERLGWTPPVTVDEGLRSATADARAAAGIVRARR